MHTKYKKAVLSQRWPCDARYISRSWAVAEIWPFEIIQDGVDCSDHVLLRWPVAPDRQLQFMAKACRRLVTITEQLSSCRPLDADADATLKFRMIFHRFAPLSVVHDLLASWLPCCAKRLIRRLERSSRVARRVSMPRPIYKPRGLWARDMLSIHGLSSLIVK